MLHLSWHLHHIRLKDKGDTLRYMYIKVYYGFKYKIIKESEEDLNELNYDLKRKRENSN
mgnify:CR=1 FL=1